VGQPAGVFERLVRSDQPDILIDLTGHVGNTIRLPSLAKRLAPVQITYLGYPDTTGVPAMDYRFTDAEADPPGEADRFATEQLVRFAPVAWTYLPPALAPMVSPLPCAGGAPVTFGCFSSPTKFTDSLLAAWAHLLAAVPDSRLLLKGLDFQETPVRDGMREWLRRQGVPLDRVELMPRAPDTVSHLAQYARMDIALDTFPYTGTTTICEALWMGRPVVTVCGDRHAARVGASLLRAIGHPEWIARNPDEYVRIVAELAMQPARLAAIAVGLRSEMQRSPLLDHAGQAACFGRALRECWQTRAAAHAE
jgi:protein O-GlcNAc transferase